MSHSTLICLQISSPLPSVRSRPATDSLSPSREQSTSPDRASPNSTRCQKLGETLNKSGESSTGGESQCSSPSASSSPTATAVAVAGLAAMKQEREESPLVESAGLSKALSLASTSSALANAVFRLVVGLNKV